MMDNNNTGGATCEQTYKPITRLSLYVFERLASFEVAL